MMRVFIYVLKSYLVDFYHFLSDVFTGYKNLLFYRLGFLVDDEVEDYKNKKDLCNVTCPLYGKFLGIGICDPNKEVDGVKGCGCILNAKLFSDSKCPMGKF